MSHPVYTFTFIILLVNVLNANAKSPQSDFSTSQTISENKTSDPRFTNKVAPSDSYSMYKHLMEVKENMVEEAEEREPKVVKTVKMALQKLLEAVELRILLYRLLLLFCSFFGCCYKARVTVVHLF